MIYVFLADGFEEIEALNTLDILRRAGLETKTVGIGGKIKIRGTHSIEIGADIKDTELSDSKPTAVILPGGMPGTNGLAESEIVAKAVKNTMQNGGIVAAICAAPSVLGKMGLLQGKRATCYPGFEKYLVGAALCPEEKVVKDGNIITAKAAGCAIEFALEIVRTLTDSSTADMVKEQIFY